MTMYIPSCTYPSLRSPLWPYVVAVLLQDISPEIRFWIPG